MRKMMMSIMAAILALLMLCPAAVAETDTVDLYEKTMDLLFETDNVTLKVTAEFSLDGQWFKKLEGTWMQDGERAFRQVLLTSPRKDGSEFYNGYTMVVDGYKLFVMEVFQPGTYHFGTTGRGESILRKTVETEQLRSLGAAVVSQADVWLGENALTETADGFHLTLGEDAPAMVNMGINELARFAAKRYFSMDYDRLHADNSMSFKSFATVTEGLLYGMKAITLKELNVTIEKDAEGRPRHAEGFASLYVETQVDGIKQLDIKFQADVSDIGDTEVKPFDPDDYGVVSADDSAYMEYAMEPYGQQEEPAEEQEEPAEQQEETTEEQEQP